MEVPKIESAGNSQNRVYSMMPATEIQPKRDLTETPPPASPLAVPSETARAQINMATVMNEIVWPRFGNTFTIGSVSVKPPIAVRAIANTSTSSWGF